MARQTEHACAQALVAVIALIAGLHQVPYMSVGGILGLNGFFIALFLGSAWLLRNAARGNKGTVNVTGINEQALQ